MCVAEHFVLLAQIRMTAVRSRISCSSLRRRFSWCLLSSLICLRSLSISVRRACNSATAATTAGRDQSSRCRLPQRAADKPIAQRAVRPPLRGCELFVAEVARLQNSPRKLNSGEFSYQFIHRLSATGHDKSEQPGQARRQDSHVSRLSRRVSVWVLPVRRICSGESTAASPAGCDWALPDDSSGSPFRN